METKQGHLRIYVKACDRLRRLHTFYNVNKIDEENLVMEFKKLNPHLKELPIVAQFVFFTETNF